ncbi:MAG TPA: LapA family protein [Oscillatoriaceae cyanobacterium M33_DOE_052]|uniref:LapA family protein n=1 Tax=Planktothricoides sp. SpSt-374 TaxID=2282167 RepID=A0A7C3VPC1_9CYAN|nr:LapA family protein [Oscillatoriaceae cyanobacterium M33_DOE_052]
MKNILISTIISAWVVGIAILSVQNATLVSLRFLGMQSADLPAGIVLSVSVAVGLIGGAFLASMTRARLKRQKNL